MNLPTVTVIRRPWQTAVRLEDVDADPGTYALLAQPDGTRWKMGRDGHAYLQTRCGDGWVSPDYDGLAQLFHETYERLAPEFGYETREETRVPWPPPNADLMEATTRVAVRRWIEGSGQ